MVQTHLLEAADPRTEASGLSKTRRITAPSVAGLAIALVALVGAVLSPWIVGALEPKAKSIDEVAVDIAVRFKDRLAAKVKGKEFVPPPEPKGFEWSKWYPAGTVSLGALAMCVGVVGFVRREDGRLSAATITVGLAAIVFQFFLLLAAALLLLLLVAIVLSALGIHLPMP